MAYIGKNYAKNQATVLRAYKPEPTAKLFHRDNSDVRGILGPVGTGKTVICCMEAWSRILEMPPCADGVRRSRWAFIRNTYPELISTTMNTWKDWVPDSICHISMSSPITAKMNFNLADGTSVEAEIIFLAIDRPEEARKLKSLELTGAFLNEASELDEEVKKMALQRTGRYPGVADGVQGDYWTGVIMDTNPPDTDHWWYRLAEVDQPQNHSFYRQPPALLPITVGTGPTQSTQYVPNVGQQKGIPPAENVKWQKLGYEYWIRQSHGTDPEWIKVFLMGEYGNIVRGKPVYPEYNDALHLAPEVIEPMRNVPLVLGFDFGLTPACTFCQQGPDGVIRIIDECISEDLDLRRFLEEVVNPRIREKYFGMRIIGVGDPAGNQRSQADGHTCMQILKECGIPVDDSDMTNSFTARRDAVGYFLTRLVAGSPALQVSPNCHVTRKGFQGEYRYKELRIGGLNGRKRYNESPDKNMYSHIADAVQYACLKIKDSVIRAGKPTALAAPKRRVINPNINAYT
jgi:hypothetical protein